MAVPLWAIGAGIKAGGALFKGISGALSERKRPKRPGYLGSAHDLYLQRLEREGMGEEAERDVIQDVATEAGGLSSKYKTSQAGRFYSKGMTGSAAAASAMGAYDEAAIRQIGTATRKVGVESERIRRGAGERRSALLREDEMAQYAERVAAQERKSQRWDEFLGGVTGAGLDVLSGVQKEKQLGVQAGYKERALGYQERGLQVQEDRLLLDQVKRMDERELQDLMIQIKASGATLPEDIKSIIADYLSRRQGGR